MDSNFLEIYNETIQDLLAHTAPVSEHKIIVCITITIRTHATRFSLSYVAFSAVTHALCLRICPRICACTHRTHVHVHSLAQIRMYVFLCAYVLAHAYTRKHKSHKHLFLRYQCNLTFSLSLSLAQHEGANTTVTGLTSCKVVAPSQVYELLKRASKVWAYFIVLFITFSVFFVFFFFLSSIYYIFCVYYELRF